MIINAGDLDWNLIFRDVIAGVNFLQEINFLQGTVLADKCEPLKIYEN